MSFSVVVSCKLFGTYIHIFHFCKTDGGDLRFEIIIITKMETHSMDDG